MAIYIDFMRLNTVLLTTHLALAKIAIRATSRALQLWNIAFKRP